MELVLKGFDIESNSNIKRLSDKSSNDMTRIRVEFKNGLQLSIVQGSWSYGGKEGLFEIGPFNKEGCLDGTLFDGEDWGDDVLGYCTKEKVIHYINKIGGL